MKKLFQQISVLLLLGGSSVAIQSCKTGNNDKTTVVTDSLAMSYTVMSSFPHDMNAFTQGLAIHNGKIYESTGQEGSWIAEVDVASGMQNKKVTLADQYFGEGITILNNKIYQLTWKSKVGFIYDLNNYKKLGEFQYKTEGWGLTHNNEHLIMSDGSNKLYFLDTANLEVVKTLPVTIGKNPVKNLNELEYINGNIFANQWETNYIYKIDPETGAVVGRLDLTSLENEIKRLHPNADFLNGIAYDPNSRALLITGKYWPKTYLIRVN